MSDYKQLCERLRATCLADPCDCMCGEAVTAIESLQKQLEEARNWIAVYRGNAALQQQGEN